MKSTLSIDVWSDIACPWCWVGKRHLEAAIESFAGDFELTWHAFELDPSAPVEAPPQVDYAQRLATKYRTSRDEGQAMIDRMVEFGRASDLDLRFDRIRPSNTFDAHRLLASVRGSVRQTALKERLFSAYLHEGRSISDRIVLTELAAEVGLEEESARSLLAGDAFAQQVREDQQSAARLGITGVPFFVFDRRIAASGAQPPEVLLEAMQRACADGEPPEA